MTLAYQADISTSQLPVPATAPSGGRERRVHHRREATRVWAQVDGGWYRVHDLSLGGLMLDHPVDGPEVGGVIEGEIHSRATARPYQTSFRATVVRHDRHDSRIGIAFEPMEPEQIDGLLAILSSVERAYVTSREADQRRAELRRLLRRLAVAAAAGIVLVAAGYSVWFLR